MEASTWLMHVINARWLNLEAMPAKARHSLDCVCNIKRNSTWQTTGRPATMAGIEVNRATKGYPHRDET